MILAVLLLQDPELFERMMDPHAEWKDRRQAMLALSTSKRADAWSVAALDAMDPERDRSGVFLAFHLAEAARPLGIVDRLREFVLDPRFIRTNLPETLGGIGGREAAECLALGLRLFDRHGTDDLVLDPNLQELGILTYEDYVAGFSCLTDPDDLKPLLEFMDEISREHADRPIRGPKSVDRIDLREGVPEEGERWIGALLITFFRSRYDFADLYAVDNHCWYGESFRLFRSETADKTLPLGVLIPSQMGRRSWKFEWEKLGRRWLIRGFGWHEP